MPSLVPFVLFATNSMWVPQIYRNATRGSSQSLSHTFVVGVGFGLLAIPLCTSQRHLIAQQLTNPQTRLRALTISGLSTTPTGSGEWSFGRLCRFWSSLPKIDLALLFCEWRWVWRSGGAELTPVSQPPKERECGIGLACVQWNRGADLRPGSAPAPAPAPSASASKSCCGWVGRIRRRADRNHSLHQKRLTITTLSCHLQTPRTPVAVRLRAARRAPSAWRRSALTPRARQPKVAAGRYSASTLAPLTPSHRATTSSIPSVSPSGLPSR